MKVEPGVRRIKSPGAALWMKLGQTDVGTVFTTLVLLVQADADVDPVFALYFPDGHAVHSEAAMASP